MSMCITFATTEQVQMPSLNQVEIEEWLQQLAGGYGKHIAELNYLFMSDEELLALNRQFLNHDYYTDILTFDSREGFEDEADIFGDIAISIDRVSENATSLEVTFAEELYRVIAHGVLHLCGLHDETPEEALQMRLAEERALALLRSLS